MTQPNQSELIADLAERLITTLDANMPADQADAIVRDVATALMTDVLGKKGYIKTTMTGFACGSFGSTRIASYEWSEL